MKLLCDICGGELQMNANNTATCTACGMNYSIETLRSKINAQNSVQTASAAYQPQPQVQPQPQYEPQSAPQAVPNRALIFERKESILSMVRGLILIIDGIEQPMMAPKGGNFIVPVTPGEHYVAAVVTYMNQVEARIEPVRINVTDHNWCGLFYIKRGAFKVQYKLDMVEDFQDRTANVKF